MPAQKLRGRFFFTPIADACKLLIALFYVQEFGVRAAPPDTARDALENCGQ
jgi:hypothetical protein